MAGQPVHSLLSMLWAARKTHLRFIAGALPHAEAPVYVIGNPSADLDSMICALVYSYFANRSSRCHIPLINIPQVPSGPELCRLRPEFVKAFWISTNSGDPTSEPAGSLLQNHILTVADFAEHLKQRGIDCDPGPHRRYAADAVLVDWNALPIPSSDGQKGKGSLDGLPMVEFTVVGCIDHHVDEGFLGPDIKPLVIEKAGSCSSLVVNTLNTMGLWTPSDTEDRFPEEEPVARLALAPLLIDTVNMNAKDKVTVIDTEAWEFLRRILDSAPSAWDRDAYYRQIHETKSNSLDLLTVDEMLDRDYKQWTESPPSRAEKPLNIGFCSMVKPVSWIVQKAGNPQAFLDALCGFSARRELDIVVVMTAFSSPMRNGAFVRELLVCALQEGPAVDALKDLATRSASQLDLQEWTALDSADADDQAPAIRSVLDSDQFPWRRIWVQGDVTKSRKQVAPLVRQAVASPAEKL